MYTSVDHRLHIHQLPQPESNPEPDWESRNCLEIKQFLMFLVSVLFLILIIVISNSTIEYRSSVALVVFLGILWILCCAMLGFEKKKENTTKMIQINPQQPEEFVVIDEWQIVNIPLEPEYPRQSSSPIVEFPDED